VSNIVRLDAKIEGFTEAGKRAYGLNAPLILKEYRWKGGNAMFARKDDRWLLAVATVNFPVRVVGIDEDAVNKDAKELGMSPKRVAQYEAEGMLRKWGWDGI
jgi:hypothetical protein